MASHKSQGEGGEGRPRLKTSHEKAARGTKRAASGERRGRPAPAHAAGPKTRKTRAEKPAAEAAEAVASDEARQLAIVIAIAALEKKAVNLEILDVAGKVDYADFLVIMTGRSDRQVQALAHGIEEALRKKGKRALAVEGLPNGTWVLMDFGDVVVHVFQEESRSLYDIEGLWLDARRLPVPVPDEVR